MKLGLLIELMTLDQYKKQAPPVLDEFSDEESSCELDEDIPQNISVPQHPPSARPAPSGAIPNIPKRQELRPPLPPKPKVRKRKQQQRRRARLPPLPPERPPGSESQRRGVKRSLNPSEIPSKRLKPSWEPTLP